MAPLSVVVIATLLSPESGPTVNPPTLAPLSAMIAPGAAPRPFPTCNDVAALFWLAVTGPDCVCCFSRVSLLLLKGPIPIAGHFLETTITTTKANKAITPRITPARGVKPPSLPKSAPAPKLIALDAELALEVALSLPPPPPPLPPKPAKSESPSIKSFTV
jgi:hypothetical protein